MTSTNRTVILVDGKKIEHGPSPTVEWMEVDRPLKNGGVARIHIRLSGDDLGINVTKLDHEGHPFGSKEQHYSLSDLIDQDLPA